MTLPPTHSFPADIEGLVHHPSPWPPCVHWPSSLGSPLLPPLCLHHPRAIAQGLECNAEGHWLMTMECRAADKNPDDNNCALLLPLPLLSLAHVVVVVILARTHFDSALPSPPSSSCHCLPPAFLIVECPHHRSIACLPINHDRTFVIQCWHHGPLFLTTTQVDCPLVRVCWSTSYPIWFLTCKSSSQLTWLLRNPQRNSRSITNRYGAHEGGSKTHKK